MDRTSEMATVDPVALDVLVRDVQTAEQDLADLITEMSQEAGIVCDDGDSDTGGDSEPKASMTCPQCGHSW
jgi:hypothetical protein